MGLVQRSDIRPGSAECRTGASPADADRIRVMAKALRREKGLVLLDPSRVADPWRREVVEQVADEQLGKGRR
ncbi:hypothetical protein CWS72_18215 [Telmatospirillum siberiense]|uniref:Uncharacterized protein n=2 Tax=Telmatospirillum siberiense TaxID=382514 RepID=A0A2N3PRX6_9PROT|nr:hypothetical protein CWS72_18215 [Telmatospirillum siberiense]